VNAEACGDCKYFQHTDKVCRRFPPVSFVAVTTSRLDTKAQCMVIEANRMASAFPTMDPIHGYCGEFVRFVLVN